MPFQIVHPVWMISDAIESTISMATSCVNAIYKWIGALWSTPRALHEHLQVFHHPTSDRSTCGSAYYTMYLDTLPCHLTG